MAYGLKPSLFPLHFWGKTLGFFNQDPRRQVLRGGPNFNKGVPCARTPCIYAHKCNRSGCGKDHPGIKCPSFSGTEREREPLPKVGKSLHSTTAPATETRSFGGVVTPVNVANLYQALFNHPVKEFVSKLRSDLREGAWTGYSGPRCPRFSHNLPTAYLNPEIVTANLAHEVSKERTMGPFPSPPLKKVFKFPQLVLFSKNIPTNSEQYSICPSQSRDL